MFSSKKNKTVLLYLLLSVLLLLGVYIPSVPLRFFDGVIIIGLVAFIQAWYMKKYELRMLTKNYDNQQKLLSEIFKYSPDLIFYKDKNLKYIGCNDAFLNLNSSAGNPIGKTDFDILSPKTAKEIREHDMDVLKNKNMSKYKQKMLLSPGNEKIYEIIKTPMIQDGKVQGILGISRDITEMYNLQQSILKTQSQLTAILENMPYIAYLKGLDGRIIIANSKIKEYFNLPTDSAGILPNDFFAEEHSCKIREEDDFIIKEKKGLVVEKQISTDKGNFWFDIYKAPVINESGEVVEIVVVAKNIDAEKNIKLQKETFIATLTHDLKTPTSAQIRALGLLIDGVFGELNEEQKEISSQILNSCKYMSSMISTILTTYKHEQGQLKLNIERYNFKELVEECCHEVIYLCKENNQTLSLSAKLSDEYVQTDKLEIKRVIVNLLSNAISYSIPNSKIEISVEDSGDDISFAVKNKGRVISQEELNTLFNRYVSNASKYKQVGTGLGLYLSKQIIEKHNGKMIASSNAKKGTSFGFSISRTYKTTELSLNS